ncbi:DNA binding domain-containing protein, excisionase family [Paenibacillus sp. UNCCL117]|uniref:helix-turn-helix domain-containing protein n=1 Tax=unclassified Paenibacillus TaxID=185978 RepID=UPI0008863C97|nr:MULTISPECIES: helix-turn-helix domain-containing protein [unclassified Paenibacillus]SDC10491.1 DNA binding domain-containing protein, excisionase family [Paenibacillus sp. cl123]SFW16389.1 DNA binding domain-containing protein, excisionase family [Paenibacillus sp. UNCCL117]
MFSNYDDVVKLSDMMEILAIGRNKAYDLLRSGQINSFKIGKAYRIPKMALKNFVLTQAKMSITSYKELAEDE